MPEGLFLFGVIVVLIVLNGLYVAAEFSVISLSKLKLEQAVAQGSGVAEKYLEIVSDSLHQDRFIAVAQMGISIASLGLGMYGEHALAEKLVPAFHFSGRYERCRRPLDRYGGRSPFLDLLPYSDRGDGSKDFGTSPSHPNCNYSLVAHAGHRCGFNSSRLDSQRPG